MKREMLDGENLFVIHDFLTDDECAHHIARSEAIGYETFTIDGDIYPGYRNNGRVILDDLDLAKALWARAAEYVPSTLDGQPASGFNSRFRYYRYTGSEAFAPHYDGSVRLGDQTSKLTFMIYLSDVAVGGETRFYGDDLKVQFAVQSQCGKALVFKHNIMHEGVAVETGSKYVLRTDVMFG